MSCTSDLNTILAAWDTLVTKTQAATTDAQVAAAHRDFYDQMQAIAVANGHPSGLPRRKL